MADPAAPGKPFPCPKCNRLLRPLGELTFAGLRLPTCQCDECLRVVEFLGERTEVALTFCVDKTGRAFDPADPDADLSRP